MTIGSEGSKTRSLPSRFIDDRVGERSLFSISLTGSWQVVRYEIRFGDAVRDECQLVINDFDIAFFDALGDRSQELTAKATLIAQFPDYKFDVKNQASFARWRPGRRPYSSTEDGVSDWLHTATAVGVRLDAQGQWELFTPYGLDDLFNGIIRPTPAHLHNPDAESKAASFLQKCTCLRLA